MNKFIEKYTKTQIRLLKETSALFGKYGYDGVSIRQIAKDSNVNISAIGYHFGGKKELYIACLQYMIGKILYELNPITKKIDKVLLHQNQVDANNWNILLDEFIEKLISLFSNNLHKPMFLLYLREKLSPTEDSNLFKDELIKPLRIYLAILINKTTKLEIDCNKMHYTLFTIIGQLYALIISKEGILENLHINKVNKDFICSFKQNLLSTIQLMAINTN